MPPRPRPPRKHGSRQSPKPAPAAEHPRGERLQKVLAAAGLGSRRECEELITAGRVEIDRRPATELGVRVDPHTQEIRVDGDPLPRPKRLYFLVHKPPGLVSTNRDPSGRPRVIDMIETTERLFTVGRLDASSEGLMLVTNDGEMANKLAHPRYGVQKVYDVEVAGHPEPGIIAALRKGVHLAEGLFRPDAVIPRKKFKRSSLLRIVLTEGKNREIRRMLAKMGHKVLRLTRVAIGPLKLGEIPRGAYRPLTSQELSRLRAWIAHPPEKRERTIGDGALEQEAGAAGGARTGGARTGGKRPPGRKSARGPETPSTRAAGGKAGPRKPSRGGEAGGTRGEAGRGRGAGKKPGPPSRAPRTGPPPGELSLGPPRTGSVIGGEPRESEEKKPTGRPGNSAGGKSRPKKRVLRKPPKKKR